MPKITYAEKRFSPQTLGIIADANGIIDQYLAQGFKLTLRQLYYQFVARALLANTTQSYKRLGGIVSDARRAGLIDWAAIEDRTRQLRKLSSWGDPLSILRAAKDSYHRDLWATQLYRVEVWIEKDALIGVIEKICEQYDVPYFSCRGYVSDSEMWSGGRRMLRFNRDAGQSVIILHLGDHDPSGIDMTRDIKGRLGLFSEYGDVEVRRIALTMGQIEELAPPPNPAKITDSRYESYARLYGEESWELDALEPRYLSDLIEGAVTDILDMDAWDEAVAEQEGERGQIDDIIKRWSELFKGGK